MNTPTVSEATGLVAGFVPSTEQAAFFTALRTSSDSLMLCASAGSGKTTTIVQSLSHIPDADRLAILFLAFNKNIVTELEPRVPSWCAVKTFHALGFATLQRSLPKRPKVDGDKTFAWLKDNLKGRQFELYASAVRRLVGYAKNAGVGTEVCENTHPVWYALMSHHGLVLDSDDADEKALVDISMRALKASNDDLSVIDFDDMLYVPLLRNLSFDKKNIVFVDEAQDTNSVQRVLLRRMLAAPPHGRLVAVGDPSQAIYGFRGADADAMNALRDAFSMTVMPLSVSYRCSKAVVAEAQKYVTTI